MTDSEFDTARTVFEAARDTYHGAASTLTAAVLTMLGLHAQRIFPAATSIELLGEYNEDSEVRVKLDLVNVPGGFLSWEHAPESFDAFEEATQELLMYLAETTGEDYLNRNSIELEDSK